MGGELNAAVRCFQSGDLAGAEDICREIVGAEPENADALHLLGVTLHQRGNSPDAAALIRRAIAIRGDVPAYYCNLGLALQGEGRLEEALGQYAQALSLTPALAEAHMNRGNIFKDQKKYADAQAAFARALALQPGNAQIHYNRGLAFHVEGRLPEAMAAYEEALRLAPALLPVYINLAIAKKDVGLYDAAAALCRTVIAAAPRFPEPHNNLGTILNEQGRFAEAVPYFERALALNPGAPDTLFNLGFALARAGRVEEAVRRYRESLSLQPDNAALVSDLVHQLQHICAWEDLSLHEATLRAMVKQGKEKVSPFSLLCTPAGAAEQLAAARLYARQMKANSVFLPLPEGEEGKGGRIRLGYLSADLHQHATAHLIAEMIERHDRATFEVTAYSFGPDDGSPMRARLQNGFETFVELGPLSHADAARKIYECGCDILVDLKGYTGGGRPQIMACRPAPVQVSFLGYPGTMGADFMDYIIADPFVAPMEQQAFYDEKIVHLPECYQPNDSKRTAAEIPSRAACGLPETGFVFCCFNNTYKITPAVFDLWMRLLKQVPDSVLWLLEANDLVRENLGREARARGVAAARLVFAPKVPVPEHLARQSLADLFLDTLPVNAHTTASDALWCGVPVLTCAGETFAGRVAGSLARTAGLPELVTSSFEEYEALALTLARDSALLSSFRRRLEAGRRTCPLFDAARFTRHLESAYEKMWEIYKGGEPPKAFAVIVP